MSSSREQFLYGAIVGAGAVALGAGAFLATSGLWCASRRQPQHDHTRSLDHAPRHGHGHGDHDHEHEGCGSDYLFRNFITGQYAPPEELALYPFTPKELIEFHRKCADVCIKHKQVYSYLSSTK
ncbi:hypothetical protein GBAR_LOCUS8187 [Geodia barretti]|uniref:Uncharacterized protein n=1 Tax=Geodia barretti TaxID=519541 RepID=A0AA35RLN1_GEOBA|nr:hypothetical protein GBAR_LOCUS8187 [Geodia barretti]